MSSAPLCPLSHCLVGFSVVVVFFCLFSLIVMLNSVISTFLWFLNKNLLTWGINYDHDTSKSMGKKFYLFTHFKWHFTCLKKIQKWFCEINGHKLLSRNDTFININVDLKKVIYLTNVLILMSIFILTIYECNVLCMYWLMRYYF